jgi:hypothetical protein
VRAASRPGATTTIQVVDMRPRDTAAVTVPPRAESPGVVGDPDLHVGSFTFDIDRIARRRTLLFPFVTDDVAFTELERSLSTTGQRGWSDPAVTRRSSRRPLTIDRAAIQAIVDRAWSRRDRWNSFREIKSLIDTYDGDEGAVPVVLRAYLAQNILQPYYESAIPDTRLWVMLALSADHIDFIDYLAAYSREHPSSRTTTELLFLLDKLVQGNRDALVALITLDPPSQAEFTRRARPDAFDLLTSIRTHYKDTLAAKGLSSLDAIERRYDAIRLRLLDAIVGTSPYGYRANDAKYLAGVIHWRAGRRDQAVRLWQAIRPSPEDLYQDAYDRVLMALDEAEPVRSIEAALDAETGRWLMTSYERLRQFGYRFDTY